LPRPQVRECDGPSSTQVSAELEALRDALQSQEALDAWRGPVAALNTLLDELANAQRRTREEIMNELEDMRARGTLNDQTFAHAVHEATVLSPLVSSLSAMGARSGAGKNVSALMSKRCTSSTRVEEGLLILKRSNSSCLDARRGAARNQGWMQILDARRGGTAEVEEMQILDARRGGAARRCCTTRAS